MACARGRGSAAVSDPSRPDAGAAQGDDERRDQQHQRSEANGCCKRLLAGAPQAKLSQIARGSRTLAHAPRCASASAMRLGSATRGSRDIAPGTDDVSGFERHVVPAHGRREE